MNVDCLDYQLGMDPVTHTVFAAHPTWQGREPTGMAGQPAEAALDVVAAMIQRSPELVLQQCHRPQASGAVLAVAQAASRSFTLHHRLVPGVQGSVVKRITVIRLVAQATGRSYSTAQKQTDTSSKSKVVP